MTRVRLVADVDPDLRRRAKIAAANVDCSISEWIAEAIRHELEREEGMTAPRVGVKPKGNENPPKSRSGRTVADAVIEDSR